MMRIKRKIIMMRIKRKTPLHNKIQDICNKYQFEIYEYSQIRKDNTLNNIRQNDNHFWNELSQSLDKITWRDVNEFFEDKLIVVKTDLFTIRFTGVLIKDVQNYKQYIGQSNIIVNITPFKNKH